MPTDGPPDRSASAKAPTDAAPSPTTTDHGPDVASGHGRLWRAGRTAWALLGIAGTLVIVGYLAGRLSLIVIPVILALFPATLLVPVAAKLKAIGVPASLAAIASIVLAFLAIGGVIGAMIPLVASEVPTLVDSASQGVGQIETFLQNDPLGLGFGGPTELLEAGRQQLGEIGDYTGQAMTAASTAFEVLAGLLLLFVVLFFYLKDGRRLTTGVVSVAPARSRPQLLRAADRAWDTLGSYFRGQLLVALTDAVFIGIGLLILDIPLAIPLSVLIFFGGLFPLVGAVTTGALAVLVALADSGLVTALIVLAIILIVQQIEGNVLQPVIMSRAIHLHPIVVLLSITAGSVLLGILGAFLAVPVAAIIAGVVSDGGTPDTDTADTDTTGTDTADTDTTGTDTTGPGAGAGHQADAAGPDGDAEPRAAPSGSSGRQGPTDG